MPAFGCRARSACGCFDGQSVQRKSQCLPRLVGGGRLEAKLSHDADYLLHLLCAGLGHHSAVDEQAVLQTHAQMAAYRRSGNAFRVCCCGYARNASSLRVPVRMLGQLGLEVEQDGVDIRVCRTPAPFPARPVRPRDKAKVEAGVLIAKRWILAVLRRRTFYSLAEMNAANSECLERLNTRTMRRMGKSRRELFFSLDRPAALPLPQRPYEYAEWRKAGVNLDYHIEVDGHYYSVPFALLRERVDVRLTATTVEAFRRGERVAAHARSHVRGTHSTVKEHMPPEHRRYAEWSPSRFIHWAGKTGAATAEVVERILASRTYPEQSYRACLGIMRLSRQYEPARVEAAARRALNFNACSYRSMRSILASGLDGHSLPGQEGQASLPLHENIRGRECYN